MKKKYSFIVFSCTLILILSGCSGETAQESWNTSTVPASFQAESSGDDNKDMEIGENMDISDMVTEETPIADIIDHPAFGEYGRFLFVPDSVRDGMTLSDYMVTHAYNNASLTAGFVNDMIQMAQEGRLTFHEIYSEEEKADDPDKEDTVLIFFHGNGNAPFAVANAGGAFSYVSMLQESIPHCITLSERGYNAFALYYRVNPGWERSYEDLARALVYIYDHAEELGVSREDYSLWGASAGARMAASLGSYGTEGYGEKELPRASTVVMTYTGHTEYTENDPPTFVAVGEDDPIANWHTMEARVANLSAAGIDTEFHHYANLGHGFGLGIGTTAEGWIDDAVSFWERHMTAELVQSSPDAKEVQKPESWSWKRVDDSYYEPAEHGGNLERITYTTSGASAQNGIAAATVYTPYGYRDNEKSRYDILYLQHGGGGDEATYLGTQENPTALVHIIDHMIENGEIAPMIIVAPALEMKGGYSGAVEYARVFPDQLVNDLMPVIEENYRTYAEGTTEAALAASRGHRAFGGFSMGSLTTWQMLLQKQEYFRYYIPMSGWTADSLVGIPADPDFFVFSATGSADFAESTLTEQLGVLAEQSDAFILREQPDEGGNLMYHVSEGYDHNYEYSYEYLYNYLPLLFGE